MVFLLLASLAKPMSSEDLSYTASSTQEIVIGVDVMRYGTLYWDAIPQPEQEILTTVGTKLVFKYGTAHDIVLVSSENAWMNCDLAGSEEIASTSQGGGARGEPANLDTEVVTEVGEYYFTCSQPGHCQAGLKMKVVVRMGSPPPPHVPPPPQAPPMLPRRLPPPAPLGPPATSASMLPPLVLGLSPAPPLLPPLVPAPAAPPYGLCFDDAAYSDGGWQCTDWTGRECRKLAETVGVAVERLVLSCPNACADAYPTCSPLDLMGPGGPPRTPPPPPPSPPPDLGWCLGYSFGESVASSVAAVLFCATAMVLAGAGLRFIRPRLGTPRFPAKRRRYTGVLVWLVLITIPALLWMIAVGPYVACFLSPAVLVIGILLWLLASLAMGVAALSDPGVISRRAEGPDIDETVRHTKVVNGVEFELKVCTTCGIVRPPRSSHDRKTDRCVLKFDHFCVFIGNTVGHSNYFWFLCFVGLTSLGAIYFVIFSLFHVFHLAGRLEREAGHDTSTAFGKAVGQATLSVVIGIYFAVMGTLVTLLFLLHCYFVSTGQTTYEFMRGAWKRTRNPFSKGAYANWMAVVRDAAVRRSQCDGNPTIETTTEYVGPTLYSSEDWSSDVSPVTSPVSVHVAYNPPVAGNVELLARGRVRSAEFQVHIGDEVVSSTLSEKMLKKSLHNALIDPFLKHMKASAGTMMVDKVIVDGEQADVKLSALSFVKHNDRVVSVHLVRPGD